MVVAKSLPNSIGYANLPDGNVRKVVMQLNENVTSLHSQLKEVQAVCKNGVGSGKSVNVETLAAEVAPLVAETVVEKTAEATQAAATATEKAALASASAMAAGTSETNAGTSETNAAASETAANEYANGKTVEGVVTVDGALQYKNAAYSSAQAAALSETNAASSATAADEYANGKYVSGTLTVDGAKQYKEAAEAARDRAETAAEECVWHTTLNYTNTQLSVTAVSYEGHPYFGNGVFNLAAIVPDTSKSYVVSVRFVSTLTRQGSSTATTKWFRLFTNVSGDTEVNGSRTYSASAYLYPGELLLDSPLEKTIPGTACFYVVNGATSNTAVTGTAGFSTIIDISEAAS